MVAYYSLRRGFYLRGITPICCNKPNTSFPDHFSTSFPLAIRWIVIDVIFISLPVLGALGRSSSCFPCEVSRVTTLSPSVIRSSMMSSKLYELFYGKESINHNLFMFLNHISHPMLDIFMSAFTFLGSSKMFLIYFPILLILSFINRNLIPRKYLIAYLFATFLSLLAEWSLKHLFDIPRPASAIGIENIRAIGQIKMDNYSLPSGHTTFAFMSVFVLSYGRNIYWKIPLFLFAFFVAYSRIYVGAHYPVDVVAGAIIGILSGFIVWEVYGIVERYCKNKFKSQQYSKE
jgi:undecaprenyl-diphosphatase